MPDKNLAHKPRNLRVHPSSPLEGCFCPLLREFKICNNTEGYKIGLLVLQTLGIFNECLFSGSFAQGQYNKFQFITQRFSPHLRKPESSNVLLRNLSPRKHFIPTLLWNRRQHEVCFLSMVRLMLPFFLGKTQHRKTNRSAAESM